MASFKDKMGLFFGKSNLPFTVAYCGCLYDYAIHAALISTLPSPLTLVSNLLWDCTLTSVITKKSCSPF